MTLAIHSCPVEIPVVVRNKALAHDAGWWVDRVPDLVADLASEWGFDVVGSYDDGTEAVVARVVLVDGTSAVLKLVVPRDSDAAAHEITVLRLVDGEGCPRLLRADPQRGAILMEELGRSMHDMSLPIERRHEILCEVAQRVWRPVSGTSLPTGADKGRWLIDFINAAWERLGHPLSADAVGQAIEAAEHRIAAHNDYRAVLVHGDVHQWNALESDDGFKLIDPDGLVAEPEYDLGIIMREDPVELMTGEPFARAEHLADLTGCDPIAIWEWGIVERVSTGLLLTEIDLQPVGDHMLAAAEHVSRIRV